MEKFGKKATLTWMNTRTRIFNIDEKFPVHIVVIKCYVFVLQIPQTGNAFVPVFAD